MPKLLAALALIGTAAMLWVGGQIFLHGLDEYHIGNIGHGLNDFAHSVAGNLPGAGAWEWLINAGGAGVFGLILCRSEERLVGTTCVSTCRSRWSTYH